MHVETLFTPFFLGLTEFFCAPPKRLRDSDNSLRPLLAQPIIVVSTTTSMASSSFATCGLEGR